MFLSNTWIAAADAGGYINGLKLLPVLVLIGIWARLLAWADKDAVRAHLPREMLNSGLFLVGLAGFALFLFLPNYLIALGVLILVYLVSAGVYLAIRNQHVGLHDLKDEFRAFVHSIGKRKAREAVEGEVVLMTKKSEAFPVPDSESPDRDGYEASQTFLTEPLRKGAERVEVRPAEQQQASISYVVDGVSYNSPPMDLASASAGIAYMKQVGNLDVEDRRKPQTGGMKLMMDGKKHEAEITTAGTTAGESMRLLIDPKNRFTQRVDTMGFTLEQAALIKASIEDNKGLVLVVAPKQMGLTSMLYAILRAHDAFLTHIQTVERAPKEDLEGITQNKLSATPTAAEESKQVEWVVSQEPDCLMVDEVTSPQSAKVICEYVGGGKRCYVGMRASSAFEAIMQWRALVGDDQLASRDLHMVIAGRVLRKLCMACKVAYTPDEDVMRKLNMDPQKVEKLYQARTQPLTDNKGNPIPCEFCQDLRYKGRTGVFEMLLVDEEMRKTIAAGGTINQMKTVFRKQKGRYLQEMALAMVEAGDTSVQEVLRVMKAGETPSSARSAAAPAAAGGRPARSR